MTAHRTPPKADGLYDPRNEHDACGVAMVARLDNQATHEVVDRALTALENLEHRGAEGADAKTGDGAAILMQIPDEFFRGEAGLLSDGICSGRRKFHTVRYEANFIRRIPRLSQFFRDCRTRGNNRFRFLADPPNPPTAEG